MYERYLALLESADNVHHIDGSADVERVHDEVVDRTLAVLGAAGAPSGLVPAASTR